MKIQRLTIALTAINFFMLVTIILFVTTAFKPGIDPVVRGNAFELIDKEGKVRAEIKLLPADPDIRMPDGSTGYPESVLFRLIDSDGGPNVKIGATEDGAGLVLGGESGYVQILSRKDGPAVKLSDNNGKEQLIELQ